MARDRHEWRVFHPTAQRAILKRLRGEEEKPDEKRLIEEAIAQLERLLRGRRRVRRLPSEKAAKRSQRSLFRVSVEKVRKSSL